MPENVNGQRHDRSALILYGSETGNSQDVAEELGRMAERLHFVTRVSEMDLVEINILLKYAVVVFAISTTGQGEFPKNARKFWKTLLRKRLPPDCLGHVSFTTFGLGDTSYPKFNWAARKLHKRLEQLGAKEVYPRGEADEQHQEGIDGTFLSWSADFRKRLLSSYPLPDGLDPIPPDVLLPPKFALQLLDIDPNSGDAQNNSTQTDPTRENTLSSRDQRSVEGAASNMKFTLPKVPEETETCPQLKEEPKGEPVPIDTTFPPNTPLPIPDAYAIKLQQNKRLTPKDHWQDVRELTFHMSENIKYQPGDVMTIYPKNFPVDVQRLIDIMGWNDVADQPLIFKPESPDFYHAENLITLIPANLHCMKNSTLRQLLTHNLDITAIPKRYFFEVIAQHTSDPMHKERLLEFTDPKWRDELFDYTTRPRRSILEVLEDFPSVKLPWQWTCTIFPVIRGRQFSISSGGEKRTSSEKGFVQVQLLVAIVKYRTVLKKIRQGLCSRYIASLTAGTTINVTLSSNDSFVKKYKNKEEEDRRLRIPIIMVAPGTGLAPCRSLVWERAALAAEGLGRQVGDIYLFYGGRNKAADYFYKHEWEFSSLRTHVFTAFSRDQKEKIYVQDIIRKEAKLVGKLMGDRKAMVYVCGSSGNMPKAVRAALVDVMAQWVEENIDSVTTASREKVEARVEVMEKDGTYVQETW